MDHAGGEPAEGGELEDVVVYLLRAHKAGGRAERQLVAAVVEARDFDDEIREAIIDQWHAENGPQE